MALFGLFERISVMTDEDDRSRREFIVDVLIFVSVFCLILTFFHFIRFPIVNGNSMFPSYVDGDRLIVLYTHKVSDDDVAVLWSDAVDEYLCKRVIGTEGDHIVLFDKKLYRNDVLLNEPYLYESDWCKSSDKLDVIVPEGHIYVMGDNRNDSVDSRVLGFFDTESVFGRVLK